jgi:hypothetical protein
MEDLQTFLDKTKPASGGADVTGVIAPAMPAPAGPTSEFEKWLSTDAETERLKLSVKQGMQTAPTEATRLLQMQTRTGLPKDYLQRNLATVEQETKQQEFDAEAYRATSPAFAAWLAEHPDHAAAAQEDLSKLNYLERQKKYIEDQYQRGALTLELSDLGALALLGTITPEQRARQAAIESRMSQQDNTDITGFVEQIPGAVANQALIFERSLGGKVRYGAELATIGGMAGLAAAPLAGPAAPVAGTTLGAFTGWRYGAMIEAGKLEMNTAYLDYEKLKGDDGLPLDRPTAVGLSVMVGAVNGALEGLTGVEALANKVPGVRALTREGIKQLLASPTARQVLLTYARQVGDTALIEGATEAMQSLVTKAGGEILKAVKDGGSPLDILGRIFSPENMAQAISEGRAATQGGGGIAVGMAAPAAALDLRKVQQAKQTEQAFKNFGEVAKDIQLRDTLPGAVRQIMENATKEGPIEQLYVPLHAFDTYFQEKGVDPREVAAAITGSHESYDQAVATGEDLKVSLADYAEKIAPTEHNQFFAHEVRTSPEAMNAWEADQWMKEQTQAEETAQQQAQSVADPLLKVRQEIRGQLEALGFDPSVVDQYAALFESRYRARAERRGLGESPSDLFSQINLNIIRPMSDILQNLGGKNTELTALLDRLRAGDVPKQGEIFGQSLVEALREKGGVQDQGGELSALGLDQTKQPFQKNLIQEGGLTLDRAAEIAAEAGYIAEPDINALLEALSQESRGQPVYVPGMENAPLFDLKQKLDELAKYLTEHGIDLQTAANEAIQQMLERAVQRAVQPMTEGETFRQTAQLTEPGMPEPHFQEGGKDAKGQITFGRGRIDIALLERADLSTFLHETGHLYLNEMITDATTPGVPEQLRADMDTVLKWMGLEVRVANGLDAVRAAVQRDQHEQFARGFEAYTLEGTSPSLAMREVFARFRQWLIQVYRLMTFRGGATPSNIGEALNVKLTVEVRKVMNRMVATEEEITAAEQEADVPALFTDAVTAGMSDREFANYASLVARAGLTARETLQSQLMAQLARERTSWWQQEREKVKAEVTAETNAHRDYIALSVLQKGLMPDGSPLPEGVTAVKLDRKAIARELGRDFLRRVPRGTTSTTGLTPESAAALFGYASGTEFLLAITNARPKQALIEAETDHRMTRDYGDPLIDGTLHDKARAAVMNEDRVKIIEAELAALNKKRREVSPFLKAQAAEAKTAEQGGRGLLAILIPPLPKVRDLARQQVMKQTVRLIKPQIHFLAAQKASREATAALAKNDWLVAGVAKQKELLNLALFREASDAIQTTEALAEHMRELRRKTAQERLGKAGADYLEQINALMARYEFTKIPLIASLQRQSLREWIAEKEKNGETLGEEFSVPESVLAEITRRNYRDVSYEELLGVRDTVQQIEHFAALKNRLLATQKARAKDEVREELLTAIAQNLKPRGPLPLTEAGMTRSDKASRLASQLNASLVKTEQIVEELDGGPQGPWHDYLWQPSVQAEIDENDYTKSMTAKIAEAVVGLPKAIRNRMLEVVTIPGVQAIITRKDLLGVALNVGNDSNYKKLLKGMTWTEQQVQTMLRHLTKEEWDFVQHIWDTLESMWPNIAALQKKLTGIAPAKVEIRPVQTPYGEYKGGYYPLMYSAVLSDQGALQLSSTFGKLLEANYVRATLPSGYRKERVEGFARPFDLNLDRLPSHIAGVIKDLTHRTWLIDANWIVNDPKIRAALQQYTSDALTTRLADWVRQVANDRNNASMASLAIWQRMIEHFRYNAMIAAMGFKASTMISQLAGIAPAIEVIGGKDLDGAKWFAVGVADALVHPRTTYNFMVEKSGEMRHRLQTRDRDIRDRLKQLEGRTDILAEVQSFSLMAIGYMELMVSMPSWIGAYKKGLSKGWSDEQAIAFGDRSVRLGQGAGAAKDLAAVAAKSDQLTRLLTMFYTPFSALYNRLRAIGHETERAADVPRLAVRMFWTIVVAGTLGELASGHGPDDKKDETWLHWWIRTMALYPFLAIPLLRDVMSSVIQGYGYTFSPIAQAFTTTIETIQAGKKVAEGDKELEDMAAKAAKAFDYMLGLPGNQLIITGQYLHDLATGDAHPDNLFQFARDMLYVRPKE